MSKSEEQREIEALMLVREIAKTKLADVSYQDTCTWLARAKQIVASPPHTVLTPDPAELYCNLHNRAYSVCKAERHSWRPDCDYCARETPGGFFPSHDASPRCESGHRDHCSCDTCF
jgi:hypothetical protein